VAFSFAVHVVGANATISDCLVACLDIGEKGFVSKSAIVAVVNGGLAHHVVQQNV
jgi:hypothetical protein